MQEAASRILVQGRSQEARAEAELVREMAFGRGSPTLRCAHWAVRRGAQLHRLPGDEMVQNWTKQLRSVRELDAEGRSREIVLVDTPPLGGKTEMQMERRLSIRV